jgi:hypothetical protein
VSSVFRASVPTLIASNSCKSFRSNALNPNIAFPTNAIAESVLTISTPRITGVRIRFKPFRIAMGFLLQRLPYGSDSARGKNMSWGTDIASRNVLFMPQD